MLDSQNESTPWTPDGLEYKDRGVEVRYDVPPPDASLSEWG